MLLSYYPLGTGADGLTNWAVEEAPTDSPSRRTGFVCASRVLDLVQEAITAYRKCSAGRWVPALPPPPAVTANRGCLSLTLLQHMLDTSKHTSPCACRFKLNLVCRSWRNGLLDARPVREGCGRATCRRPALVQ